MYYLQVSLTQTLNTYDADVFTHCNATFLTKLATTLLIAVVFLSTHCSLNNTDLQRAFIHFNSLGEQKKSIPEQSQVQDLAQMIRANLNQT